MSKHINDQERLQGSGRVREFVRHERESAPGDAAAELHSRPQTRGDGNRKAAEFMRIERGEEI